MYPHPPRATIDAETRSACSLSGSGAWRYTLDPTTEILCLAYRLPHWERGRTGLWHPAMPHLGIEEGENYDDLSELLYWVQQGELVEAHNSFFERAVWKNLLRWRPVRDHQWRCSAAKAAALALPRALKNAAPAIGVTIQKSDAALRHALDLDGETTRVMTKLSKPRNPIKADWIAWNRQHGPCGMCGGAGRVDQWKLDGDPTVKGLLCVRCGGTGAQPGTTPPAMPRLWHETVEIMQLLWGYCRLDVLAEEALSEAIPDLSPEETEVFILDQAVNERGFQLDLDAVDAALTLIDGEFVDLNAELKELTNGAVDKATQRARMAAWFESQGCWLPDTRGATVDDYLQRPDLSPPVRRGLELLRTLGRSSTAKYVAMHEWACDDGRVRGGLLYHGATTGRWSGKGVQPHNFPKGITTGPLKKATQDDLWDTLLTRDAEAVKARYGNVMEALSHGLRGAITATPGQQLYVADFAGIEARVLLWAAGDDRALDVFRNHEDIYCEMATAIYGYPTNKTDHPKERGIGKIAVLGLGYQMGPSKFVDTCAIAGVDMPEDAYCRACGKSTREHRRESHIFDYALGVTPDTLTAVKVVDAYRDKFWRVKNMWEDQEQAAICAVQEDDVVCSGVVEWRVEQDILYCVLPSGRRLAYPNPQVRPTRTSWGQVRDQLTFMGVDSYTHKWKRQHTYGGMLVENIVQAVARDLMAASLLRCERSGLYVPVLTVHDELVAEAPLGQGDVKAFERLMAELPDWAAGCPVEAEGWAGVRYHK